MNSFDRSYRKDNIKLIAGTDEAGRGPLAGPVVAASVIFPEKVRINGVRDSKILSEVQREKLYPKILQKAMAWSVAVVSHGEIDRINILQASLLAMSISINRLNVKPDLIFVDGNKVFRSPIPALSIVDGDAKSFSIAAASIIAKVTRDRIMKRLSAKFPVYNWESNKGYGTKEHVEAIKNYGPCVLHRKSFLTKILSEQQLLEFSEEI